ncbi:hypothetical protein NS206_04950 [Microbacterium testaceum]|nr:hypothetical protein NS206_04950 [Microbacterium testaceum]
MVNATTIQTTRHGVPRTRKELTIVAEGVAVSGGVGLARMEPRRICSPVMSAHSAKKARTPTVVVDVSARSPDADPPPEAAAPAAYVNARPVTAISAPIALTIKPKR